MIYAVAESNERRYLSVREQANPVKWTDSGLSSLELFTGAGGLALGSHLSGFHHDALIEWNPDACETIRSNVSLASVPGISKWSVLQADAREVAYANFSEIDLIAGGPPCQPFSIGGKHAGWEDQRDMIPEFVRAVRELKPSAFILENVRGLTRSTFRQYFNYIYLQLSHPEITKKISESWTDHLRRLEDIHTSGSSYETRYNVVFDLLNSADFGVPQLRERVFLVGFRADLGVEWHFPNETHSRERLLFDQNVSDAYWERHAIRKPLDPFPFTRQRPQHVYQHGFSDERFPWLTVRDAVSDLWTENPVDARGHPIANTEPRSGARPYKGHTGSPLDWPAKTLKAGDHGVPGGENMIALPDGNYRYFSVREAARIQTFPDGWKFEGAWSEAMRQLGNAVPVTLARVVSSSVAQVLIDEKQRVRI